MPNQGEFVKSNKTNNLTLVTSVFLALNYIFLFLHNWQKYKDFYLSVDEGSNKFLMHKFYLAFYLSFYYQIREEYN